MIKYFSQSADRKSLEEIENFKDNCLVYLEQPTDEELEKIVAVLALEIGHLKDALDPYEVPRLETEGETAYIFTRLPWLENGSCSTTPILFIIAKNFVAIIVQKKIPFLDKYFLEKNFLPTAHKIKLFFQLFSEIIYQYNTALTTINRKIYYSSAKLERIQNRDIIEFINYEQALNDFLNALVRTNTILNNLLSGKIITFIGKEQDLIEDLFLANGQLIELAQSSLQNVKNIRDAYSTILTNNLNRVIKLLTSLTIILTVPTMISSFFGMNVKIPLAEHPLGFLIIAVLATTICLSLVYVFTKKDWF